MTQPVPFEKDQPQEPPALPVPVPALHPYGAPLPVLVQIGDITCTETTVSTPSGDAPIDAVFWNATDMTRESQRIPTWAIVVCILTVLLCFVGLLFLLIKETKMTGYVQVSVQGPDMFHTTNVPAGYGVVQDTFNRVNFARGLTQQAKNRRQMGQ